MEGGERLQVHGLVPRQHVRPTNVRKLCPYPPVHHFVPVRQRSPVAVFDCGTAASRNAGLIRNAVALCGRDDGRRVAHPVHRSQEATRRQQVAQSKHLHDRPDSAVDQGHHARTQHIRTQQGVAERKHRFVLGAHMGDRSAERRVEIHLAAGVSTDDVSRPVREIRRHRKQRMIVRFKHLCIRPAMRLPVGPGRCCAVAASALSFTRSTSHRANRSGSQYRASAALRRLAASSESSCGVIRCDAVKSTATACCCISAAYPTPVRALNHHHACQYSRLWIVGKRLLLRKMRRVDSFGRAEQSFHGLDRLRARDLGADVSRRGCEGKVRKREGAELSHVAHR